MPCQNNMERMPATLKTREKARKYHFFPRKSILVLRKNSTGLFSPLSIYDLARNFPNYERPPSPPRKAFNRKERQGNPQRSQRKSTSSENHLSVLRGLSWRTLRLRAFPLDSLNAQRFSALLVAQNVIEDHARHEHRREQVRQQAKRQRGGKSAHRARAKD